MPLLSIKEVSTITGIPAKNIHTLAGRDKLVKIKVTEKGKEVVKIDTTDPINEAFMFEHEKGTTTRKTDKKKSKTNQDQKEPDLKELSELQKLTLEKKQLDAKRAKMDMELKEIEIREKRNEIIDLNKAITITSNYSSSHNRNLDQLIQTHIQDICARHDIEASKTAQYKSKVSELINESTESSIKLLLKQLES